MSPTLPAVVLIVPAAAIVTAAASKVTPEVTATAPLAVTAALTLRVSTLAPTLKLEAASALPVNKSTGPDMVTVSVPPAFPKMEIPENNPVPAVLFAEV